MIRKLARVAAAAAAAALPLFAAVGAAQATPAGDGVSVQVRIQDEDAHGVKRPLPDVKVAILDATGAEVGSAVTDQSGVATVSGLEGQSGSEFEIVVDESTLGEGDVIKRDPQTGEEGNTRKVTIGALGKATKNLFTGEGVRVSNSKLDQLPQRIVDGTRLGLVIAITSVGLSLIFGTTGLTNFAHGEMVTFGGMTAFLLNVTVGIPLLIAGPITVVVGGFFGYFLDWGLWGRLRRRGVGLISQMVVSVGLSILLRYFFLSRFGGRTRPLGDYATQEQWTWWKVGITPRDLSTSLLSLAVLIAVAVALQRTRLGKATRAVADNVDLASATGIDTQKVIRLVWFLGGALAALGGIVRALDEQVGFEMGSVLLFLMFAGITLGGLGSAYGALVGGFLVGVATEVLTLWVPTELKNVPPLLALILVLLIRPQGILGKSERIG